MIIDGKEYGYHYPLGVLRQIERKAKIKILALTDTSNLSAEASAYLVYYGVKAWARREDEPLEMLFEEFLDIVTLSDFKEAVEAIVGDMNSDEEKKRGE